MAFVHCHNCSFEQDDFWDLHYNPVTCVQDWTKELLTKDIDEPFTDDAGFIQQHGNLSRREVIAREFERQAKKIRGMWWRTEREFKEKNPEHACPRCGKFLDVD